MNREDIIKMAREIAVQCSNRNRSPTWQNDYAMSRIMELIDVSAAAERSACAQVCDEIANKPSNVVLGVALDCAAAIRARGKK